MRSPRTGLAVLATTLALGLHATTASAQRNTDSATVVKTIEQFHGALESGDSAAVRRLLANDVIVLESGSLETRGEYLAHHLSADIEFARAIHSPRKVVAVKRTGNAAWVTSTSVTSGTFKGRAINSDGAELMVLTKTGGNWQIRAIHWSSARRQTNPAN